MARKKPVTVHHCSRCGNEEDLVKWGDGETYCDRCLTCDCVYRVKEDNYVNGICLICLRRLFTVVTFDGPRISDMAAYLESSGYWYGLRHLDLLMWTYDEEEARISVSANLSSYGYYGYNPYTAPIAPPPHFKFRADDPHGALLRTLSGTETIQ